MDEEGGRREGGKENPLHFQKYLQSCKLGPKQGWQIGREFGEILSNSSDCQIYANYLDT